MSCGLESSGELGNEAGIDLVGLGELDSTADGRLLWLYDTNRDFETVNGVTANGGGMDGPGAIVAGGMLFFNSGYGGFGRPGGNVLLAFGPAD
jgi:hypothetical protein